MQRKIRVLVGSRPRRPTVAPRWWRGAARRGMESSTRTPSDARQVVEAAIQEDDVVALSILSEPT